MKSKNFIFVTILIAVLFMGCESTKVEYETISKNYTVFVDKDMLPNEVITQIPNEPLIKRHFLARPTWGEFSHNIDFEITQRCSKDKYRIMGMGFWESNWGHEIEMSMIKKSVVTDLKRFCIENGGYELYCEQGYNYTGGYTTQVLNAGDKTMFATSADRNQTFTYYIITPYSEKETNSWHLGLQVRDTQEFERQVLKTNNGVAVLIPYEGFPAFEANILPKDIILEINGIKITNTAKFAQVEADLESGSSVIIAYLRDGIKQTAEMIAK